MKILWYIGFRRTVKETGPLARLRERRWLAPASLGCLLAALSWWLLDAEVCVALATLPLVGLTFLPWDEGDPEMPIDIGFPTTRRPPPGSLQQKQQSVLSVLERLFMRHRPRWLPPEVRGDVTLGTPDVAETNEDALAEELVGLGLDEMGRFIGQAVGLMKDRQAVMWDGQRPRDERFRAAAEHRAIHDVALDQAKRAQGALADVVQGRRSVGEGLRELFDAVNPLPIAHTVEEVRKERETIPPEPTKEKWTPEAHQSSLGTGGGGFFDIAPMAEGETPFLVNPIEASAVLFRSRNDAKDLADELARKGKIAETDEAKEHARNFIRHFLGGYRSTKLYGPLRAWQLGVVYEDTGSRFLDWWQETPPEEASADRETDLANNLRGISAALDLKNRGRPDIDIALEEYLKHRRR